MDMGSIKDGAVSGNGQDTLTVRALSPALGAEITGLALADLSDRQFDGIERALHEHLVVIVRDQDLSAGELVAFARRFGEPEPHVLDQFHHRDDGNVLILSNRTGEDGEPLGLADGGTYFHSDYSYLATPARCTILHAREIPGGEAGTRFANQRAAFEALPEAEQRALDGLVCRHHYGNRDNLDETTRTVASPLSGAQKAKMKWERHPLVRRHPHTGERALYAVSGSSFAIEGMGEEEGVRLLDRLKTHATGDAFCFTPDYRVGDVVIWDNASLLHEAPLVAQNEPRTLWRVTVLEEGPTMRAG